MTKKQMNNSEERKEEGERKRCRTITKIIRVECVSVWHVSFGHIVGLRLAVIYHLVSGHTK